MGVKTTLILHEPAGGNEAPHAVVPAEVAEVAGIGAGYPDHDSVQSATVVLLVNVTVCAFDATFTSCPGNVSASGDSDTLDTKGISATKAAAVAAESNCVKVCWKRKRHYRKIHVTRSTRVMYALSEGSMAMARPRSAIVGPVPPR